MKPHRAEASLAFDVHGRVSNLGICLGAQLLARALGPGEGAELGFAPVDVCDAGERALPERAAELEAALVERTGPGFAAFAEIVAAG